MPAWVLGTWAHKALFLKKGLSETALGSESVSWPHPSPVHLLGLVTLLPVKWTVMHSCGLRAVPPGLASSSQASKGAVCKSLKTRRLGPRQDSPHSGRQSHNVAARSGPAPGHLRAQPGEVRSARVCPEPLHMCPPPVCPRCCHPRRMASPLPSIPTSQPQRTQERQCAGWGSPRKQRPPRTTLSSQHRAAHGLPAWSLGCVPLRVLALQPCRQHIFHTRPVQDRRTGQTCPPAPAPLFPDPSERKRESCVSMRGCRSPVGSSISVSARVRLGAQGRVSMLRQTGAVRRPQCPPAGTGSQASSTPPTVRSSRGLKKEDSYPRGSTCKEHLALLGFLERERR